MHVQSYWKTNYYIFIILLATHIFPSDHLTISERTELVNVIGVFIKIFQTHVFEICQRQTIYQPGKLKLKYRCTRLKYLTFIVEIIIFHLVQLGWYKETTQWRKPNHYRMHSKDRNRCRAPSLSWSQNNPFFVFFPSTDRVFSLKQRLFYLRNLLEQAKSELDQELECPEHLLFVARGSPFPV